MFRHLRLLTVLAAAAAAVPNAGGAQLLGGQGLPGSDLRGTVDRLPLPNVRDTVRDVEARTRGSTGSVLTGARILQRDVLLRRNPRLLETDPRGEAVIRGEVLALSPTAAALANARSAGFEIESAEDDGLGLGLVVLKAPPGMSAREAVSRLRRQDPEGRYDFNHVYLGAGSAAQAGAAAGGAGGAGRLGLIDGGVDASHPALRRTRIEQKAFAPGGLAPSAHGLAVASLMIGDQSPFRGVAPDAALYVADVYGPTPAGGSARAIASALGWMAQVRAPVVNISLVGPANLTLEAAVAAVQKRGHVVVAAVGNDGPAAPPLYPAAYPGVVGVTAVDARGRALPEAARGPQVDFAAPGADMAAAAARGFVGVRGTSFAAPIVAAELSQRLLSPDPRSAAEAVAALARAAKDAGSPGPDRTYGHGVIGVEHAISPARVGAKGVLAGR